VAGKINTLQAEEVESSHCSVRFAAGHARMACLPA
jgi:hypothetical protein